MTNKEINIQIDKILKQEQKIQNFYDKYTKEFLQLKMPLADAFYRGLIHFSELKELKMEEYSLYEYFYDEPQIFSDTLERIMKKERGQSHVIPSYYKTDFDSLSESFLLSRLKNQMYEQELIFSDIVAQAELVDKSIDVGNYHFSHIVFQEPDSIQQAIKGEFLRIFLIQLQKSIDANINLQNLEGAHSLLLLQNHILMQNPTIEFDFFDTLFPYDDPFYLNATETLEEDGASSNAVSYINEEFVKEQAMDAITSIVQTPFWDLNYGLHSLYLYSAMIQSRDETTSYFLQDFFYQKYGDKIDSIDNDKLITILEAFRQQDKVKSGFEYVKKAE